MDTFGILAQSANSAMNSQGQTEQVVMPIERFWEQITALNVIESLTFIAFGAVCLFYGWRIFKMLVVINFGLLGLILGMLVAGRISGLNNQLMGGLIGMVLFAVMCIPLMKWSVCILGALAGAVITSGIWYALGLDEQFIWAGGLTGLVAGGMLSFVVFKVAVMLFTSLWGSTLLISGALALLTGTSANAENLVLNEKWFLPAIIMIPTLLGLMIQYKMIKEAKDWDI